MKHLLCSLFVCGSLCAATIKTVDYTIVQGLPGPPPRLSVIVVADDYLNVPVVPFPAPGSDTAYPEAGGLYTPATCSGQVMTSCSNAGDGVYWWTWSAVGTEAEVIGEQGSTPSIELFTFPTGSVLVDGVYPTGGEASLMVRDPLTDAPEPTDLALVVLGLLFFCWACARTVTRRR